MLHRINRDIAESRAFFIDGDGTIYIGNEPIPGAVDFLGELNSRKIPFYLLTNNSSRTPDAYLQKVRSLGIEIELENVIVSIDPVLEYLRQEGIRSICSIATDEVNAYIRDNGFEYSEDDPQAVLLTYDTELNYRKLELLTQLLARPIPYLATHIDISCPSQKGNLPDIGTFIKMMEMAIGRTPDLTFGKPSARMIDPALAAAELAYEDVVMIGDRLYTDIKMGDLGLTSVLVLTGETDLEEGLSSPIEADIICDSIKDLMEIL